LVESRGKKGRDFAGRDSGTNYFFAGWDFAGRDSGTNYFLRDGTAIFGTAGQRKNGTKRDPAIFFLL